MTNEFDAIRPFEKGEMKQALEELLADRHFQVILKSFVPWMPKNLRNGLLRLAFTGIDTPFQFQKRFMRRVVLKVLKGCCTGITFGHEGIQPGPERYTFVSNHRDIVLDSAILSVLLFEKGFPTTVEIAIGDNLLIYPWIEKLVRLNKAFIVRRSLTPREMYKSSKLMSEYIHFAVDEKRENIWIAQREGRAKDSSDHTQPSVLKMLAMGGEGTFIECLKPLNIVPLTISYEYDPCDYLKAKEFQLKRDDPKYRKSRKDDLENMKTGIMGFKGRVRYECAPCINTWLDELEDIPNGYFYEEVAARMDREIHRGYTLFPGNYIAADMLEGTRKYESHYTAEDEKTFKEYLKGQLAKIDIPNKDEKFLSDCMLMMYANPVRNKAAAEAGSVQ